jgi:Domain of unknown function (DUF4962)/Heparinase II/III-like protein
MTTFEAALVRSEITQRHSHFATRPVSGIGPTLTPVIGLMGAALFAVAFASTAYGQVQVDFPSVSPDPLAKLQTSHPRLIADVAQFESIADNNHDPILVDVKQRIIASAEAMENAPLQTYKLDPQQHELLNVSRAAFQDIVLNAMAYRLTHESRFAERAKRELLNVSGFKDWDPASFLSTGEMAMGVALGYDWTYDYLTANDRSIIENALMDKALTYASGIYGPKATNSEQLANNYRWLLQEFNWQPVCNGGMLAAALALADKQPAAARMVIQGVRAYLPIGLKGFAPDGAWFEGPSYMAYTTAYTTLSLAMLKSALGTDFGLDTIQPAFAKAGLFHLQEQSPNELLFNYGDSNYEDDETLGVNPAFGWWATHFNSPDAATEVRSDLQREFKKFAADKEDDQYFAFNAVWLPAEASSAPDQPLDAHFAGDADVAMFRSAWNDPDAIYLGFKAGTNGLNHSHLDLGSFVFDSDGVRWSIMLGPDSYGLPNYNTITPGSPRWTYFRCNNASKGAIAPYHAMQSISAVAPIYAFSNNSDQGYAVADLSSAYPSEAKQILTGVFLEDRKNVLIQDDVTELKANTRLTWLMLTQAGISISDGGRTATLTQSGKTLRVQLLSPSNATFNMESAAPSTPNQNHNTGYMRLVATVPSAAKAANVRLAILLSPIGSNWPATPEIPKLEALPIPPQ